MGEKRSQKGKKRPIETKPAKKKETPKKTKKTPQEERSEPKAEAPEETKKKTPQIEWSDDGDEDEEGTESEKDETSDSDEDGSEKTPKTAKKIPVSDGVKKKLADLLRVITGLQSQLAQKGREAQEVRNSIMLLSADYQELNREHEFIKLEMAKKDALIDKHIRRIKRFNEDFDKVRERQKDEKDEIIKKSGARVLKRVLEIAHDFDMAIKEAETKPENKPVVDGFVIVRKQLEEMLISEKVEEIPAMNEAFDPRYHEAVEMVEDKTVPADTVVEVIQNGYLLHGTVLRPTKVRVSRGGPERERPKKEDAAEDKQRVKLSDMPQIGEKVDADEQASEEGAPKDGQEKTLKREKPAPPPDDEPGFDWAEEDAPSKEEAPSEEEVPKKKKPKRPADEPPEEKQAKLKEAFEELDEFLETEEGAQKEDTPKKQGASDMRHSSVSRLSEKDKKKRKKI